MKRLIALSAVSVLAICGRAEVLTPAEALQRATADSREKIRSLDAGSAKLVHTFRYGGIPTGYVFSLNPAEKGFMLVAADDVAAPVLGFSEDGVFDPDNIPQNMAAWIENYSREIAYANEMGLTYSAGPSRADKSIILPLMKTKWNQTAPYNNDCPKVGDVTCVTGCVATAAGQIMKYHDWPVTGSGTVSYQTNGYAIPLTYDFSNANFAWDDMLYKYTDDATDEQKAAVANLLFACGVAANMDYRQNESLSNDINMGIGLINNLGYSKEARYYQRDVYSLSDWQDLIYDQLSNYGPVLYSGSNAESGHTFVCDGYFTGGYFSINWGWGGLSDGYFRLSALDPFYQGVGGSTAGYNQEQAIIGNITPDKGLVEKTPTVMIGKSMYIEGSSANLGGILTVPSTVYNKTLGSATITLGLKATGASDETYYFEGVTNEYNAHTYVSRWQVRVPSKIEAGDYTLTLAYKDGDGVWHDTEMPRSAISAYKMQVSGSTIAYQAVPAPTISVTDISHTPIYINMMYMIKGKFVNPNPEDYYGTVHAVIVNDDKVPYIIGEEMGVELSAGETLDFEYTTNYYYNSAVTVTPGTYTLYMLDGNGMIISEPCPVEVVKQEGATTISFGPLSFVSGDPAAVKPSDFSVKGTVKCESGYYANNFTAYVFPVAYGTVTSVATLYSEPVFLGSGEEAEVHFSADLSGSLLPGKNYYVIVRLGSSWADKSKLNFTVEEENGINDVLADDVPDKVNVYTIDGRCVTGAALAPGHYIRHKTYSDGSTKAEHYIVK